MCVCVLYLGLIDLELVGNNANAQEFRTSPFFTNNCVGEVGLELVPHFKGQGLLQGEYHTSPCTCNELHNLAISLSV